MKDIVIFGLGPMARNAYYGFTEFSEKKVVAFTVDKEYIKGESLQELPVVDFEDITTLFPPNNYDLFVAMSYTGVNAKREQKCMEARQKGYQLASFIHPKAAVYSDLKIGDNCFISSCVSVQPNVKLGNNVFLRENCNIGHDTSIDDNCYIGGGSCIAGYVQIKKNAFLGKGAVILESITIEEKCIIGAGVTMLEDAKPSEVYVAPKPTKLPFSSEGFL